MSWRTWRCALFDQVSFCALEARSLSSLLNFSVDDCDGVCDLDLSFLRASAEAALRDDDGAMVSSNAIRCLSYASEAK